MRLTCGRNSRLKEAIKKRPIRYTLMIRMAKDNVHDIREIDITNWRRPSSAAFMIGNTYCNYDIITRL